jgi:hypothetical protein
MASFYGLLGSGGDNSASLGVTGLVLDVPLTRKDALVLLPLGKKIDIPIITPPVTVIDDKGYKLFIRLSRLLKFISGDVIHLQTS